MNLAQYNGEEIDIGLVADFYKEYLEPRALHIIRLSDMRSLRRHIHILFPQG